MAAPSDTLWVGIRRHGAGWRASVSRGSRPKVQRHFPQGTAPQAMQEWRADVRARHRLQRKTRAAYGTFEGDARRYLRSVTALASYVDRVREIEGWIQVFGQKPRDGITALEIRAERDRLLTTARAPDDPRPLAANTVNKRLRALANLYTVLDGPHADNPARDVTEAPEPTGPPRALDYPTIEKILAALPDVGRANRHDTRPTASLTKVRLRILAYTGMTPSTLMRMTAADVDYTHALLTLPARRKGRGVARTIVPLLPKAAEAFRDLDRLAAWGRFSVSSLRKSFKTAAAKQGVQGIRPHDLRHSLGTTAYELTGSIELVMWLLQHASRRTTDQYVEAVARRVMHRQARPLALFFGPSDRGAARSSLDKSSGADPVDAVWRDLQHD